MFMVPLKSTKIQSIIKITGVLICETSTNSYTQIQIIMQYLSMRPLLLSLYKYNEIEHSISAWQKIITGKSILTILPRVFELNFYFQPSIYFFSSGSIVPTMFDNVATLQHRFTHLLCPILFNSRYASFINQMDSDKRGFFFFNTLIWFQV